MPDTTEPDDAAGEDLAGLPGGPAPAGEPEIVIDAESVIALAEAQAADDEADQVDLSAEAQLLLEDVTPGAVSAGMGSEAAARDEERRTMNGAREGDMHRVQATQAIPAAAASPRSGHEDHDHDHDHGSRRRLNRPAKAAGPIMMLVALGWLARQLLKRPKSTKKSRKTKRR